MYFIFMTDQLLHIVQKEKIAPKIAAKITGINGPLQDRLSNGVFSFI